MKLDRLESLYRSMRAQSIERYSFQFLRNHARFDVLFFTDVAPFELLFGCVKTRLAFTIQVKPGFIISPKIDPISYRTLCDILQLRRNPANPFRTTDFFEEFNRAIPLYADKRHVPPPHKIAVYKRHVEEADKIYFCGWRDNSQRQENATESNLQKTRELLGYSIYEFCKRKNISSRWTDNPQLAKPSPRIF